MGGLEFTQSQKGILMGVGTGILYFLPVLTGAIADRYGYKKYWPSFRDLHVRLHPLTHVLHVHGSIPHVPLLGSGCRPVQTVISATIAKTTTDETASMVRHTTDG